MLVRHVAVAIPRNAPRLALRFRGVRHSTESFIASVYVGGLNDQKVDGDIDAPLAGTIPMYGHGSAYGDQAQLDAALDPFDVDIELKKSVLPSDTKGSIVLSIVVRDLDDRPQPAEWLRFAEVTATPFP